MVAINIHRSWYFVDLRIESVFCWGLYVVSIQKIEVKAVMSSIKHAAIWKLFAFEISKYLIYTSISQNIVWLSTFFCLFIIYLFICLFICLYIYLLCVSSSSCTGDTIQDFCPKNIRQKLYHCILLQARIVVLLSYSFYICFQFIFISFSCSVHCLLFSSFLPLSDQLSGINEDLRLFIEKRNTTYGKVPSMIWSFTLKLSKMIPLALRI